MRVLATVVLLVLASTQARADELDEARKLEASLEYERALVLVDNAIARGGFEAGRLAELHFEAGKLAAGLDHAEAAQDHFARALAVEPSLELPAGTSPKIAEPFQHARERTRPLKIDVLRDGARVTVQADDPLHLVVEVRVEGFNELDRKEVLATRVGPPYQIVLRRLLNRVNVIALDEHDNELFVRPEGDIDPSAITHEEPPRWYQSFRLWATVGTVGLAAFGGFSAWRESVAQDEWNRLRNDSVAHDYSQLRSVEDRGKSWALAADISLGIAGSAALIATLWWITDRSGPSTSSIGLTAGPGSVGVAGRF